MNQGAERRVGGEGEVYEQENEEGEGGDDGRGEVAIGARELGLLGRGVVEGRLVLEDDLDAAADLSHTKIPAQISDMHTDTASQRPFRPTIRLTIPDNDSPSIILPSHDTEHGVTPESCYSNTLDQQRRQRVRFDEALRMHSYGGSQYVGRVVDEDAERRAVMKMEREDD